MTTSPSNYLVTWSPYRIGGGSPALRMADPRWPHINDAQVLREFGAQWAWPDYTPEYKRAYYEGVGGVGVSEKARQGQ